MNSNIKITKYHFKLEAIDNIILPAYKGSTFHGGFGRALMQISPIWYQYFFEPKSQGAVWPKPYIILPPLDNKKEYLKGYRFNLELTLIGEARQHYAIAQAAIEHLGLKRGLGHEKGKYKIIEIVESKPALGSQQACQQIRLNFPTRLRLKANNKLCRHPPEFHLLMTRLLGRIKTLEQAYLGTETDSDYQHYLLTQSKDIKITNSSLQWKDWDRFSGSQKHWMKFGGLMGEISYSGDLQPFMESLILGTWLHIGGKTSFGLGKYQLKSA